MKTTFVNNIRLSNLSKQHFIKSTWTAPHIFLLKDLTYGGGKPWLHKKNTH